MKRWVFFTSQFYLKKLYVLLVFLHCMFGEVNRRSNRFKNRRTKFRKVKLVFILLVVMNMLIQLSFKKRDHINKPNDVYSCSSHLLVQIN